MIDEMNYVNEKISIIIEKYKIYLMFSVNFLSYKICTQFQICPKVVDLNGKQF